MADLIANLQAAAGAGGGGGWDISTAVYDPGSDAWDVSKATYTGTSFSVSSQDGLPTGLFFKPDGTKMYLAGSTNDKVYEYNLSTAWVVSTASYVQDFSVSTQDSSPNNLFFKPDGTKMYVLGGANDKVYEYSLSTAWNISTASFVQDFSVATEETSPQGLFFKPDGTKMYVCGTVGGDVNEYTLSTAWNVSTASYVQNFSVSGQDTIPTSVFFKPDGATMYICGSSNDTIYQYSLSTPWNISTASYASKSFSISVQDASPQGLFFHPDGINFYFAGLSGDRVYQYVIGGFSVAAQGTVPRGVQFKTDGTKMYVVDSSENKVSEYTLSTAWDITTASYVTNYNLTGRDTTPQDLFFKSDGTKMYTVGSGNDKVYEFNLSTAWDLSTVSFSADFSISAQEVTPTGLFFKDDGTKMYVVGQTGDDVNEYTLSTGWSVTTASYVQVFSVASQDGTPSAIFFKDDGTEMYILGINNDKVYQYTLSSAWDVSSASFTQDFSVAAQDGSPLGLCFKTDGTKMFICGSSTSKVYSYTLG